VNLDLPFQVLDLLKEARVAVELGHWPSAASLWTSQWGNSVTEVPFKTLANAISKCLSLNQESFRLHFRCLEALIAKEKKPGVDTTPVVDIHKFGLSLCWFGPMGSHSWDPPNVNFLVRLLSIMSRPWFFGEIDRQECEDILRCKKKKGTFLVRLNLGGQEEPSVSPFIISKLNKEGRVEHIRVYPMEGFPNVYPNQTGFFIHAKVKTAKGVQNADEAVIGDFEALLKRLKSKEVISEGLLCQRYKSLFAEIEGASMYFGRTESESIS